MGEGVPGAGEAGRSGRDPEQEQQSERRPRAPCLRERLESVGWLQLGEETMAMTLQCIETWGKLINRGRESFRKEKESSAEPPEGELKV